MADIFISYVRKRRRLTQRLSRELEAAGYSVWWDTSLLPNQNFRQEIDAQLDRCKAVIIIWTPEAARSDWVLAEADHARGQGKLINTRIASLDPEKIPKPFNQHHTVLVSDLDAIAAAVEQLAGKREKPPAQPSPWFGRYVVRVGAALAGLALIAAYLTVPFGWRSDLAPAPRWALDQDSFVGRDALLKWTYGGARTDPVGPRAAVFFEVANAADAEFKNTGPPVYVDAEYTTVRGINGTRHWRVRAVDLGKMPLSEWSAVTRLTQFDSAYRRIKSTGQVAVYVSDSKYQDVFKWWDKSLALHGFDIELVRAVTAELPLRMERTSAFELRFVPVPFTQLLDMPAKGLADLVISAISKRKRREEANGLRFSDPYFCTTQALMFGIGENERPVRAMIEGRRVAYQKGTTSEQLALALGADTRFERVALDRTEDVIGAMLDRSADFAVTDTPFAAAAVRAQQATGNVRLRFKSFGRADFPASFPKEDLVDEYAIAVRRGEDDLLRDINDALGKLKREGTLARLLAQAMRDYADSKGVPLDLRGDDAPSEQPWLCPGFN